MKYVCTGTSRGELEMWIEERIQWVVNREDDLVVEEARFYHFRLFIPWAIFLF